MRSPSIKSTKPVGDLSEHFTLFIGGVATMLNTGLQPCRPRRWRTFAPLINAYAARHHQQASEDRPRIIQWSGCRLAATTSACSVCMSQARPGETFDVKLARHDVKALTRARGEPNTSDWPLALRPTPIDGARVPQVVAA